MLTVNKDAIVEFIGNLEGFRSKPYLDSVGVATIGYGTTMYPSNKKVTLADPEITMAWAGEYLWNYIIKDIQLLTSIIIPTLNENESTAIISLSYNIGFTNFSKSTLCKLINNGSKDSIVIMNAFMMWNKIKQGGELVPSVGLTNRRKLEAELYLS